MLEILQFIFSSFWVWLGFTIIIATIVGGLAAMFNINIVHSNHNGENKNND